MYEGESSGLRCMCGRPVVRGGLRLRRETECGGGGGGGGGRRCGRRCEMGAGVGWMSDGSGCGVKSGKF